MSNKLRPDPQASGDHSTFARDVNGDIYKYETYQRTSSGHDNPVERFDGGKPDGTQGAPHDGLPTPHVNNPKTGKATVPTPQQTPNNNRFKPPF